MSSTLLGELNPLALKLRITSRTRSSLVKVTLAMAGTSMLWADSSTIRARHWQPRRY